MAKRKTNEVSPVDKMVREQQLEDLRQVMSTPNGRRFVWRFLSDANVFRSCFTGNSTTFYLEGRRDVVLPYYQDIMQACPEMFWKAQQENLKFDQEVTDNARPDSGPDDAGHE